MKSNLIKIFLIVFVSFTLLAVGAENSLAQTGSMDMWDFLECMQNVVCGYGMNQDYSGNSYGYNTGSGGGYNSNMGYSGNAGYSSDMNSGNGANYESRGTSSYSRVRPYNSGSSYGSQDMNSGSGMQYGENGMSGGFGGQGSDNYYGGYDESNNGYENGYNGEEGYSQGGENGYSSEYGNEYGNMNQEQGGSNQEQGGSTGNNGGVNARIISPSGGTQQSPVHFEGTTGLSADQERANDIRVYWTVTGGGLKTSRQFSGRSNTQRFAPGSYNVQMQVLGKGRTQYQGASSTFQVS